MRHHDFRMHIQPFLDAFNGRFGKRAYLHEVDFREGDAEADTAMAQHRIDFMQHAHFFQYRLLLGDCQLDDMRVHGIQFDLRSICRVQLRILQQVQRAGQYFHPAGGFVQVAQLFDLPDQLLFGRQELVYRRIKQPDGHGQSRHGFQQAFEVGTLNRQQAIERQLTLRLIFGDDHFQHDGQTVAGVEHAFGPAQPDAFCTQLQGAFGVIRRIGIRHHGQPGFLVCPCQQHIQLGSDFGFKGSDDPKINHARGTVDGDDIAFMNDRLAYGRLAQHDVDFDAFSSGHTGLAHPARDHCGMRSLPATAGQNAARCKKSVYIFRLGLFTHQDDRLAGLALLLGAVRIEDGMPGCGTRRSRQTLGQRLGTGIRVQAREQHLRETFRRDTQQCLLARNQSFLLHLHRAAHHRGGVHLAVAGLQTIQRAFLDGELEVLHFVIMVFQLGAQLLQLPEQVGHFLGHVVERLGSADARHHILALRIHQIFAIQQVFAGGGVARKTDSGGRIIAAIAEHHGADINRRTIGHLRRDFKFAAVINGAFAHP